MKLFIAAVAICLLSVLKRIGGEPRIVGGASALAGQFPYHVGVLFQGKHVCGGSIISQTFVLTIASCVTNSGSEIKASDFSVRAGSLIINSGGIVVRVENITISDEVDGPALLALVETLTFDENINKVQLAEEMPPLSSLVVVSGWGYLTTYGPHPLELQFAYLQTRSDEFCEIYFPQPTPEPSDQSYPLYPGFCADPLNGTQGICFGDFGGPGVYNHTLLGVIRPRESSCESGPYAFAKIPYFREWISKNSDVDPPTGECKDSCKEIHFWLQSWLSAAKELFNSLEEKIKSLQEKKNKINKQINTL